MKFEPLPSLLKILLLLITFGTFHVANALEVGVYQSQRSQSPGVKCQVTYQNSIDGRNMEIDIAMDKSPFKSYAKEEEEWPPELYQQQFSIPFNVAEYVFGSEAHPGFNKWDSEKVGNLEIRIYQQNDGVRRVFLESLVPDGKVILRLWIKDNRISLMDRSFKKYYFPLGWTESFVNRCAKPDFIPLD